MKKCLGWSSVLILFFFLPSMVQQLTAQTSQWKEKDYANYIHSLIGGEKEVSVTSGRIDLVTDSTAFEIEWAPKWKQSIGQALWYAIQTNKRPGIILIMRSREEYKYFIQLNSALNYADLSDRVDVYLFPNDFSHLMDK